MTTTRRLAFALLTAITFILTEAIMGTMAPAPDFTQAEPAEAAVVIPSWADVADDFPHCTSVQAGTDDLATIAVVADAQTGQVSTMTVAKVWDRALDKKAGNDVWTLGLCPR